MATDLNTIDQAAGQRALAWRALNLLPSTTTNLAEHLGADAPACIDAAIAKLEHELRAVPLEPEGRAEWAKALDERVRRLAVKVLPTAKAADTIEWRTAMVDALADLPAMVSLTAAKRAIHRPFRFIGEIEIAVRDLAAEIERDRREVLAAFRRHAAEIEDALNPAASMIAAPDDDAPISADQIRAMTPLLRNMGLRAGFITQDEIDAAVGPQEHREAA